MARLYGDTDKYGDQCGTPVVEAFHGAIKALVRKRFGESGQAWNEFVFGRAVTGITAEDFRAIDRQLLAYGHRYVWSALVSQQERPDAYQAADGVGEDVLKKMDSEVRKIVAEAAEFAMSDKEPDASELYTDVMA